jgi:hypothetical protein
MTLTKFLRGKLWLELGEDWKVLLGLWAGGFAGTEVLGAIMNLLLREDGELPVPFGPLFLLIFGGIYLVLLVASRFSLTFGLGVQMSVTRKRMLLGEWLVAMVETAYFLLLIRLAFWLDKLVILPLWGEVEDFSIPWWAWLLVFAGVLLLGYVGGALLCRYGIKGFWGLWGFFVLVSLAPQLLGDTVLDHTFDFIAAYGVQFSLLGVVAAVAVVVFVTVQMLRVPVK